jgi:hypothetical protein
MLGLIKKNITNHLKNLSRLVLIYYTEYKQRVVPLCRGLMYNFFLLINNKTINALLTIVIYNKKKKQKQKNNNIGL